MSEKRKTMRVKDDDVIDVDGRLPGHTHYIARQDVLRKENIIPINGLPSGNNLPTDLDKVDLSELNFDQNAKFLVVYDNELRSKFIKAGIIGESVGVGERKSDRRFEKTQSSFTLSSFDVYYAFDELNMIDVDNEPYGRARDKLIKWGKTHDNHWFEKYSVYRALRSRGFLVLDGINYGTDFAVYMDSVEEFQSKRDKDHAPILVDIKQKSDDLSIREMIKSVKLADRVQKDYIIMRANGRRSKNGVLTRESSEITAYMVDVEPMGVDRKNDINAVILRKLKQSGSYNVIDIEIKKERF